MRLARAVDDRCHVLHKQGRLPGSTFSQLGHEAIAVGAAWALGPGDIVAPMHRDLGAYLVRGMTPGRVFAQHMGRVGAPSRGRDVNTHGLGDLSLGIYGYVSHLPQSMPTALGAAFAFRYRSEDRVAMTWYGDGSSSEGGAHETLNLASVLRAPVVFLLENNGYAFSTPVERQCAVRDIAERAAGYDIPFEIIDGNDVEAVWRASKTAVERARRGEGPTLIECKTMRMRGHAIQDPGTYVPEKLLEEWRARDPIDRLEAKLLEEGTLTDGDREALGRRIAEEIDAAVEWAEASPWPDPATQRDGVFAP